SPVTDFMIVTLAPAAYKSLVSSLTNKLSSLLKVAAWVTSGSVKIAETANQHIVFRNFFAIFFYLIIIPSRQKSISSPPKRFQTNHRASGLNKLSNESPRAAPPWRKIFPESDGAKNPRKAILIFCL